MAAKARKKTKSGKKKKQPKDLIQPVPTQAVTAFTLDGKFSLNGQLDEIGEPDDLLLAQQQSELEDLSPAGGHEVTYELAEDPVRLYLREIGQVKLLDADSEFRLATFIEAQRQITNLHKLKPRKGVVPERSFYYFVM